MSKITASQIQSLPIIINNNGTISSPNGLKIVSGWGAMQWSSGTGTTSIASQISFGTTFSVPPQVHVTTLGWCTPVPSDPSSFNGTYGADGPHSLAYLITTTNFVIEQSRSASATFGASYIGFSWIAIGT